MKLAWIALLICLLSVYPLYAERTSHTDATPSSVSTGRPLFSPNEVVSAEAIGKFRGNLITQDAFPEQTWNYLAPNEHFNHLFEACLPKDGGVYIAVGTFRGLDVASSGKVSHLVLMDIDSSAVLFNKLNLQLIAKATDRFQYLSYLFTGTVQPDLEKEAREGKLSFGDFINSLRQKNPVPWKNMFESALNKNEWSRFEKNLSAGSFDIDVLLKSMSREFRALEGFRTVDKTIMGNDARFQQMQRMIQEKRVTVIAGDIAGDKSMYSLNEVLRGAGQKVAAVDISNVPDYLDAFSLRKAFNNMRALPFKEDGRVFYTGAAARVDWDYYALNQRHLAGMERFPLAPERKYGDSQTHELQVDRTSSPGTSTLYSSKDLPCTGK